jgi:hypothetical protein
MMQQPGQQGPDTILEDGPQVQPMMPNQFMNQMPFFNFPQFGSNQFMP